MLLANKLLKSRLFSGISLDDVNLLVNCLYMHKKTYGTGEYVHHINEIYDSIGFVISGKVHMIGEDFWGNRNLIQEFSKLEFYGEAHSMTKLPMFFNIVAVKKSEILFINTDRMLTTCNRACSGHQQLIANLMRIMSEKKLGYMHKADFLSRRTTRSKITAYLSEQARLKGSNDFSIPYNRQYLADYLAVDRSALSRELSKMKEEGILDFNNDYFTLINPDK